LITSCFEGFTLSIILAIGLFCNVKSRQENEIPLFTKRFFVFPSLAVEENFVFIWENNTLCQRDDKCSAKLSLKHFSSFEMWLELIILS
jgi:hypothetical protein